MSVARSNSVELFDGTFTFTPAVGMHVRGDEWSWDCILMKGERQEPIPGFDGAEFTIATHRTGSQRHINVILTGKKPAWKWGANWLRCNLVFVGDCEPDEVVKGWIRI